MDQALTRPVRVREWLTRPTASGRERRGGVVAIGVALATAAVPVPAYATDWSSGYSTAPSQASGSIIAVDTSVTATDKGSIFVDTSVTAALTGDLEQVSGWRVRGQGQIGTFDYVTNGEKITGNQQGASGLIGYEWVEPDIHAAAYIGFNYQNIKLNPNDPDNDTRGHGFGVRVVGEIYANPTDYTLATAYATYSSLHNAYYTRFKLGYALFDRTFIGPEFSYLGDDFYRQWRLGVHLTGLTLGRFQFGLAGGYMRDSKRGPGGYVLFDSRVTF